MEDTSGRLQFYSIMLAIAIFNFVREGKPLVSLKKKYLLEESFKTASQGSVRHRVLWIWAALGY